jgi:sugar/nucleoside kinase (ribokinase family)
LELCSVEPEQLVSLVRPCLPHLDLLIVNDREISIVAGSTTFDPCIEALTAAAKAVLAQGSMQLVVVHFPMGAIAVDRSGTVASAPSVNVPPDAVIGANGAGDAFAAGFLYGFHQGWGVAQSLALAHAAAAASLRHMSTTAAIEPWADCLALAERWGWRPTLQ